MANWSNDFDAEAGAYPTGWADDTESNGTVGPSTSAELAGVGGGYGLRAATTNDVGTAIAGRAVANGGATNIWSASCKIRATTKVSSTNGEATLLELWSAAWSSGLRTVWLEHLDGTGYRLRLYERNVFGTTRQTVLSTQPADNTIYTVEIVLDKTTSPWEARCYLDGALVATVQDAASGSNGTANDPTRLLAGIRYVSGSWGSSTYDYDVIAFNESQQAGSGGTNATVSPPARVATVSLLTATVSVGQTASPVADVSAGAWTGEDASTTNLYTHIDEAVAADADYVRSSLSPGSADELKVRLGPLADPAVGTGHIASVRYGKDLTGGDRIDLTVNVYAADGTTLVATRTFTSIDALTTATITLTTPEADAIPSASYASGIVLGLSAIKV